MASSCLMTRKSSFMSASLVVIPSRVTTLLRLKCQWPRIDLEECEPSGCVWFGGAPSSDRCAKTSAAWPRASATGRITVHVEGRHPQSSLPKQRCPRLLLQQQSLRRLLQWWLPRLLQWLPKWSLLQQSVSKVSARQRQIQYIFRIAFRCSLMTMVRMTARLKMTRYPRTVAEAQSFRPTG